MQIKKKKNTLKQIDEGLCCSTKQSKSANSIRIVSIDRQELWFLYKI